MVEDAPTSRPSIITQWYAARTKRKKVAESREKRSLSAGSGVRFG